MLPRSPAPTPVTSQSDTLTHVTSGVRKTVISTSNCRAGPVREGEGVGLQLPGVLVGVQDTCVGVAVQLVGRGVDEVVAAGEVGQLVCELLGVFVREEDGVLLPEPEEEEEEEGELDGEELGDVEGEGDADALLEAVGMDVGDDEEEPLADDVAVATAVTDCVGVALRLGVEVAAAVPEGV